MIKSAQAFSSIDRIGWAQESYRNLDSIYYHHRSQVTVRNTSYFSSYFTHVLYPMLIGPCKVKLS